jgi:small conductance mechanosensitive channel
VKICKKRLLALAAMILLVWVPVTHGQTDGGTDQGPDAADQLPDSVDVRPTAEDEEIEERLSRILDATGWYASVLVDVRDGVVFLDGRTGSEDHKAWAGSLARKTQDVVAVVNRLEIDAAPTWDLTPAWNELQLLWNRVVRAVPVLVFALIVLPIAWLVSVAVARLMGRWLDGRVVSPLLATILARLIAIPFFLFGVYIVLQVAGLTRLALTVVGGTGIAGIVVGFAFRDIAENFLASVLLSMRRPFRTDDFIEVDGFRGLVRQMNTRSTVLMTQDGNHVQIPNATIFKSTIVNMTANPNTRAEFVMAIGYENSIHEAQDVIGSVLRDHPAVLNEPAPWVLVDELGSSSVNLRCYFWFDFTQYSKQKLTSALMRQSLRALEAVGITAPDDAREVIFPQGVPVISAQGATLPEPAPVERKASDKELEEDTVAEHEGEGGLESEAGTLKDQSERARAPEEGRNLLDDDGA